MDDAHWADRPSLSWLAYLADRLTGVPLLLVIATRDAEPGAAQDLLDTLAAGETTTVLRPRTLTTAAVQTLVTDGFGRAPEPSFSAACGRASGGNPLLLGELVRELGVGAHVPFKKLDRTRLKAALREVLRPEVGERARLLGERIRAEGDGLPAAATALDDWLVTAEATPTGAPRSRPRSRTLVSSAHPHEHRP